MGKFKDGDKVVKVVMVVKQEVVLYGNTFKQYYRNN